MADGASKDEILKIDAAGTLTDVSAYLTSLTFNGPNGNVIQTTTFGDTFHTYIRGLADLTFSIEGIYDPYMGTLLFALGTAASTSSWEFYPQGTASGKLRYGGECLLTSASIPGSLDEAVTYAAEFQVSAGGTVAAVG